MFRVFHVGVVGEAAENLLSLRITLIELQYGVVYVLEHFCDLNVLVLVDGGGIAQTGLLRKILPMLRNFALVR